MGWARQTHTPVLAKSSASSGPRTPPLLLPKLCRKEQEKVAGLGGAAQRNPDEVKSVDRDTAEPGQRVLETGTMTLNSNIPVTQELQRQPLHSGSGHQLWRAQTRKHSSALHIKMN